MAQGKQSKQSKSKNASKLTRAQRAARVQAARERQRLDEERRAKALRTKQIFTVVVCIILVLALGIPTIALTVLSS